MTNFPAMRHPAQLSLRCRFLAPFGSQVFGQSVSHVDKLLIRAGGREFYVVLLGVAAPDPIVRRPGHEPALNPKAAQALATLYRLIDCADRLSVELPPTPRIQAGCWERGIADGSTHPGYLWLSDTLTLNEALLTGGACTVPNRLDRYTLRRFAGPRSRTEQGAA